MDLDLVSFSVVGLMAVLILGLGAFLRNPERARQLVVRRVDAFDQLPQKAGEAVEGGTRIHVSLGTGTVGTPTTTGVLAGLTVLDAVAETATISDKPPVITTGEGASATLAQNSLRRAYNKQNAIEEYDALSGRMAGPTPLSYTAGVMATLKDETVSTSLLIGTLGNELALMADAGRGEDAHQIIGTDDTSAQAAAYVMADQVLIGEDVYASGAYLLGGKPFHRASLHAQDAVRILLIAAIIGGPVVVPLLVAFGFIP